MSTFLDVLEDVTKRGTKIPFNQYLPNGKYPIIDQGQNKVAGYTDQEEGLFTEIPAIIFGDHTRIIKYVDEPCFLGADGVKLLKAKSECSNHKYLYYVLLNAKIPDTGYNRHFKWLKEIDIPIYDEKTQSNIVNELDKITYLINKRKIQLEKLDELVKARFVELFGDPVGNTKNLPKKTLPELGELGRGVSKHRPRNAPELLGGKYPLIQTGEVANAELYITSYENTYSEIGFKQSKMWDAGTLCITIAANIAKTAILTFDACFPDSVVGFNANEQTNNIFIHYWFSFFQAILEAQAPESAQKNINLKVLSELEVIVPPIEEQMKFVSFVKQTDKSKVEIQKSLEKLKLLKKALLQKYFG
ncbi:MAG: restriction endonuclease subunit S [Clostridia bacterium]|nr:restriction endonuclease subunit S [Clostridia bacterium]